MANHTVKITNNMLPNQNYILGYFAHVSKSYIFVISRNFSN